MAQKNGKRKPAQDPVERVLKFKVSKATPAYIILLVVLVLMSPGILRFISLLGSATWNAIPEMVETIRLRNRAIAPFFTAEVSHWEPHIRRWAHEHNLDPNLLATVMQIESCGWQQAQSYAGAMGLFQVMPFHFKDGENMADPDTNARRGAGVLNECLGYADGDVGLAMACYNGGPGVLYQSRALWDGQVTAYYKWGTGIYQDAQQNRGYSATLEEWLRAGGQRLCDQAAQALS
jgi:soluble lytic murein transglycosylase-like protein